MRILVVEDDAKIAQYLRKGLGEAGYRVDHLESAEEALSAASLEAYDVLVVDLMLPGKDGFWLIGELRGRGVSTPILILSARQSVDDRVRGIRAGGDDYMTKPFSFSELQVRIEALIRRTRMSGTTPSSLSEGDITMDLLSREVRRQDERLELQPREFSLLELFLRHPGQVLTKTMILEHVWSYDFDPQTNVVDVLVSRLRGKIDRDFEPKVIHTIRGVGYAYRPGRPAPPGGSS
ncbi:MAG: DNA-binding response regulator [Spirochaetaceae bacterium]|nr:MAG: DNA-binding response regulator [Spirochaetaceae bacterium]